MHVPVYTFYPPFTTFDKKIHLPWHCVQLQCELLNFLRTGANIFQWSLWNLHRYSIYVYFPTASEMTCRLGMNILSYRCKVATEHKIT